MVRKDSLTLVALQVDYENLDHAHGQHQREDHNLHDCDTIGLSFEYLWAKRVQGEPDVSHLKSEFNTELREVWDVFPSTELVALDVGPKVTCDLLEGVL